jgi:hypothetical protein
VDGDGSILATGGSQQIEDSFMDNMPRESLQGNHRGTDRKLKAELLFILILMICAIAVGLAAYGGWLRPKHDLPEVWFQRSGAITSMFSIFAQFRINDFLERIRGGTFAESWRIYKKFIKYQTAISWTVTIIGLLGAFVWGYGDLLFKTL